jgi:hypothetical protein
VEYEKFLKGCGFWMRRWKNVITIYPWEHLMAEMVYGNRIEIWRTVKGGEIRSESLCTNSTPKLRKLMRALPDSSGKGVN